MTSVEAAVVDLAWCEHACMAIAETLYDAPDDWPPVAEVRGAIDGGRVAILPEQLSRVGDGLIAAFRRETQAVRVYAKLAGVDPVLLHPDGAEVVSYQEHAADWVLPALAAAALVIPSNIAADLITHEIIGDPPQAAPPTVRFQQVVIDDGRMRVRSLEGPADELVTFLRTRTETNAMPPLTDEPPSGLPEP